MKKFVLVAFILTSLGLNAQYFQHTYGHATTTTTGWSGANISYSGNLSSPGYLISGRSGNVVRTDADGNVPSSTPYFNNFYEFTAAGTIQTSLNDHVFESDVTGNLGVVGWLSHNSSVYYLSLNPDGTAIAAYEYTPPPTFVVTAIQSIEKSSTGTELYITGWATETSQNPAYNGSFILKIDIATGTLLWSNFYLLTTNPPSVVSSDYITDIIESPFSNELIAIGNTELYTSPRTWENFLIRINPSTGAVLSSTATLFGNTGTSQPDIYLTSISVCNESVFYQPGFILAGTKNQGSYQDVALIRVNQYIGVIWSKFYDYGGNPNTSQVPYDIIERDAPGGYEYYVGGYVSNGSIGGSDAYVLKVDVFGSAMAEFTFGDANYDETCRKLDLNNFPPEQGLSIFGTRFDPNTSNQEKYFVKSYFNGVTACDYDLSTPSVSSGPTNKNYLVISTFENFGTASMSASSYKGIDNQICYVFDKEPPGDNSRVAPPEEKGDEAGVAPNPVTAGSNHVFVEVFTEGASDVDVAIYDVIGKQYYNGTFTLAKGNNKLQLDISKTYMAAGTYIVKLRGTEVNNDIMLLVK